MEKSMKIIQPTLIKMCAILGLVIIVFFVVKAKFFNTNTDNVKKTSVVNVYGTPLKATQEMIMLRTSGVSKASKRVNVLTETSGHIYKLPYKKGAILNPHDTIAIIQLDDRTQQLKEAKAGYELAKENLNAAEKLAVKNFISDIDLKSARLNYESASSKLAHIEKEIDHTNITAPFKGVLEDLPLNEGSVVAAGTNVAILLNLNPILIQVYVSEKDYLNLYNNKNHPVKITFPNQQVLDGHISFISSIADPKTHMFLLEISAENPDFSVPEGMTAKVDIPTHIEKIQKINPSSVYMDDKGILSVKVINKDNKVESYPIQLIQSVEDTLWVTGIPDETVIITYGLHFVNVGDTVQWKSSDTLKGPNDNDNT